MQELVFLLVFAVPLALAGVFLYVGTRKRIRLKPKDRSRLVDEIMRFENRSASERIVGYDKVLDHLLSAYGYKGTLGEKLKKEPQVLRGKLDDIWKLHKIRNRLVHDLEPIPGLDAHAERYRKVLLEILT